jgi:hypothetical protein
MDPAFWALNLKYPVSVEACSSTRMAGEGWEKIGVRETFPRAGIVRYKFPARKAINGVEMPEVKLNWYDGGLMPPRPESLEPGRMMGDKDGGVLFMGDKGIIMCGCYASGPRLVPESLHREYRKPEKTIPRVENGHEGNWIDACKGGPAACSNFEYAGPFTESVVMGNLAMRNPHKKLDWDGENMRFTNDDEANAYVHSEYREGWTL